MITKFCYILCKTFLTFCFYLINCLVQLFYILLSNHCASRRKNTSGRKKETFWLLVRFNSAFTISSCHVCLTSRVIAKACGIEFLLIEKSISGLSKNLWLKGHSIQTLFYNRVFIDIMYIVRTHMFVYTHAYGCTRKQLYANTRARTHAHMCIWAHTLSMHNKGFARKTRVRRRMLSFFFLLLFAIRQI